jgi:hypothetical protein
MLRPLDLDNLTRRDIPQYINGAWFGWHAFRRGLGTRLNEPGVDDTEIQSILRRADASTTQAFYILPNRERAEAGLRKLDKTLHTKYGIRGQRLGLLAQWLEQSAHNRLVPGSSPGEPTNKIRGL